MSSPQSDFDMIHENLLFVGFLVEDGLFNDVAKKDSSPQYAAQNYQKSLLKVLGRGRWKSFSVFGSVPCSPYPKNKLTVIPPKRWGEGRISGPVFNLPGVNFVLRMLFFFAYLVFWSCKRRGGKIVFLYALHTPHVLPLLIARFIWGVKVIVYVPDLPMYMNFGESDGGLKRVLKKLDSKFLLASCNRFDARAVITPAMFDYVDTNNSAVVDTIVDESFEQGLLLSSEIPNGVNFTYTGGLRDGYGVVEALEYFSKVHVKNKGWNLLVFGAGPLRDVCLHYASLHDNIHFYGQVSIHVARFVQSKSDFLLNLRDPSDNRFNYSYPSKITEYMASGTPVVTTRIAGIPKDLCPYLNFVELSLSGLEEMVKNSEVAIERAAMGKEFLLSSRSINSQFDKLAGLIKEI